MQNDARGAGGAFIGELKLRALWGTCLRWDWPTIGLFGLCLASLALALSFSGIWTTIGFVLLIASLVLHSSLTHEILHGHPFRSERAGTLLGVIQPGLLVPYLRFKRLHLAHHHDPHLTDPYDDPETNFLDPEIWAGLSGPSRIMLRFNNTLLGRMIVGPLVSTWSFVRADLRSIFKGDRQVLGDWLVHLPGAAVVLWLVSRSSMPIWAYLLACYLALSVLKIRTFLEHRAHERCSARTVVVEDRGPLAFLFLNNNLHVVHHMHPNVSWYHLPGLYRAHKQRYLRRNQDYVYRSYGQIFREFLWRTKDPVAHPLWRGPEG